MKQILVSITDNKEKDCLSKIKEINKLKIPKVALFLTHLKRPKRNKIYQALTTSKIKEIPLAHIRDDTKKEELIFLKKNFKTKYFTIHEDHFKSLNEWKGFHKQLFLEMDTNNFIPKSVRLNKIGGFCIDLSHFKINQKSKTKEFKYVMKRKNIHKYFACNHVNGYSYKTNKDLHTVNNLKDFNYLKTLPKFLFGKVIAIEAYNPISQQLKFRKYILKLLK